MDHIAGHALARVAVILVFPALLASVSSAWAADDTLQIKVRLVRCVTPDERLYFCGDEGLCCDYLEPDMISREPLSEGPQAGATVLKTYPDPAPEKRFVWLRQLTRPTRIEVANRL